MFDGETFDGETFDGDTFDGETAPRIQGRELNGITPPNDHCAAWAWKVLSVVPDLRTSDHLANERTFLAWLRTSISLTSLGFVVSRFSVWLREVSARIEQQPQPSHTGWSLWIGISMMLAGAFLAILSARRYRIVKLAIEEGKPSADTFSILLVTGLVILLSVALIVYMLFTSGK